MPLPGLSGLPRWAACSPVTSDVVVNQTKPTLRWTYYYRHYSALAFRFLLLMKSLGQGVLLGSLCDLGHADPSGQIVLSYSSR